MAKIFAEKGYRESELLTTLISVRGWKVEDFTDGPQPDQDVTMEIEYGDDECTVTEFHGPPYLAILVGDEISPVIEDKLWAKWHELRAESLEQRRIDEAEAKHGI